MPDWPAVSFAQLSDLPTPSGVTRPMPVTTTTGRPALSRFAFIGSPRKLPSSRLHQRHAFAAPVTGSDHDNLGRRGGHFNLGAGLVARRKQFAMPDRERGKREAQW